MNSQLHIGSMPEAWRGCQALQLLAAGRTGFSTAGPQACIGPSGWNGTGRFRRDLYGRLTHDLFYAAIWEWVIETGFDDPFCWSGWGTRLKDAHSLFPYSWVTQDTLG